MHPEVKFIVILPTNILKEEVACKLDIKGVSVFMTASVRGNGLIPGEIREEIQDAHNMGMHEQGKRILKEYRDEIKDDPDVPAVIKECDKILDGLNNLADEQVIVTTHAHYMNMPDEIVIVQFKQGGFRVYFRLTEEEAAGNIRGAAFCRNRGCAGEYSCQKS